tara:strand:- start:771 stop:1094 length:324 start_codon:yes stop_codon:yes gene_type:complete
VLDENLVMETNTLLFPFAQVIFGKSHPILCEVVFDYAEYLEDMEGEDGEMVPCTVSKVVPMSLTATFEDGKVYDMLYLVDEEDAPYRDFIINSVVGSRDKWNQEVWW